MSKPVILHLAVDVNTPQRARTTSAIEWLVDSLDDSFDNVVIAYQRRASLRITPPQSCQAPGHRLYHFPFFGLKFGIGLLPSMKLAARRTIRLLEAEGIQPNLVHAHKLTFEGLAGDEMARHFGVPLFVSLRGEVETKVFRRKPFLRPLFREISLNASKIYFVSAWFRNEFHRYVPAQPEKERLLPNIVRNVTHVIPRSAAGDRFVTVLNLDTWQRKGISWLLDALVKAVRSEPAIKVDIVGGGSEKSRQKILRMIAKRKLEHAVSLTGAMQNEDLLARLSTYRALLLPSVNETFGMVYVEALFSGLPILYTKGTGIDGYLDGLNIGYAVPPRDIDAIATAILSLWTGAEDIRNDLINAGPHLFEIFDPSKSLTIYRDDVVKALGKY